VLDQERLDLGALRLAFNGLCDIASAEPESGARDDVLKVALFLACQAEGRAFGISRENVSAAVETVIAQIEESREGEGDEVPDDWLKSDSRESPTIAAGLVLEQACALCENPPSAYSPSTTADYARRLKAADHAYFVRYVRCTERLTYIATALGVPLARAPWVAAQIDLLIAGYKAAESLTLPELQAWLLEGPKRREPAQYRRFMRDAWPANVRQFRQALVAARTDAIIAAAQEPRQASGGTPTSPTERSAARFAGPQDQLQTAAAVLLGFYAPTASGRLVNEKAVNGAWPIPNHHWNNAKLKVESEAKLAAEV
jgi:hypothetical protein